MASPPNPTDAAPRKHTAFPPTSKPKKAPARRSRRVINPKPLKAVDIPYLNACDQRRLWTKIRKGGPDQCWHWTGASSNFGYGRFKIAGKLHSPHRLVYALKVGKIVNVAEHHGTVVMHTCDNPACCNPAHLKLGRQIDNALDMAAKGRCGSQVQRTCEHTVAPASLFGRA
jgi:hypothetical protein